MIPSRNEVAQESFKSENTAEGWDGVEPRDAPDIEEPAGIEDSDTGSHVPPESLQEPGQETSASLCALPDASPPAEATKTKKKKSSKRLSSEPEGGPTAKKRDVRTEHSRKKNKNDPSTDLKETNNSDNNAEWHFLKIEENNNIVCEKVAGKTVLDLPCFSLPATSDQNQKETLNDINGQLKTTFLNILKDNKGKIEPLVEIRNTQSAFVILEMRNGEIVVISSPELNKTPEPGKQGEHSEDFIIKESEKYLSDLSQIYLYSVNSPCLGRKESDPCMLRLITFSENHNIDINIGFSRYYVFIRSMHGFIKGQKISWNPENEYIVHGDIKQYIYTLIPEKDNGSVIDKNLDKKQTYKQWIETGKKILKELENSALKKLKDLNFNQLWIKRVDDDFNRHVVPPILKQIQDIRPKVNLFQVDLEEMKCAISSNKQGSNALHSANEE